MKGLPIVYSCSGCSSAAQTANSVALRLDRERLADMSCIAGVGGDVPGLLKLARSGRPIAAIDGCPLHCVRHCLERHGIFAELHYDLSEQGVKKMARTEVDPDSADAVFQRISKDLAEFT